MSDPSGLRAGVERLIAEWEKNAETLRAVSRSTGMPVSAIYEAESAAKIMATHAEQLRALLAKHPPTPPAECPECGGKKGVQYPHGGHLGHVRGCPTKWETSPPSEPSPVEQEHHRACKIRREWFGMGCHPDCPQYAKGLHP